MLTSLWTGGQIFLSIVSILSAILLWRFVRPPGNVPSQPNPKTASPLFYLILAIVGAFLIWRGNDPIGIRPDSWMDASVLIAGRNYARDGLTARWGVPLHQVTSDHNPPDPYFIYTRHPVGANLINGMMQRIGIDSERVYRLVPLVCALTAVCVWRWTFGQFVGKAVASLAAMVMATAYGFISFADTLYFHSYAMLTTACAAACFVRAMQGNRRKSWICACAAFVFLGAMFTWEYHLWLIVFFLGYSIAFDTPVRRRWIFFLILPLFLAAGLHSWQRQMAEAAAGLSGSQGTGFRTSIFYNIYLRTIGFTEAMDTPVGVTLAKYPSQLLLCFYRFYGIPLAGFMAIVILNLHSLGASGRLIRNWPPATRFMLLLTISGGIWWCVMLQHSSIHGQVMRHMLPAYSLAIAITLQLAWGVLKTINSSMGKSAAVAMIAVLAWAHLEGTVCAARLHLDDSFLDARGRTDVGPLEGRAMAKLESVIPPGGVILTNLNRPIPMRLWSRRPVYETIYAMSAAQRSRAKRTAFELAFNHLRQLYGEKLPKLYYVYFLSDNDPRTAIAGSVHFRFMLTGEGDLSPQAAWDKSSVALQEAYQQGSSAKTFCPIVAVLDRMICFDLSPAVTELHREFDHFGFPTLLEFEATE